MNVTLEDGQRLAERAAADLEDASAQEIIQWAADTFGDGLCMTSSMADALMVDLASKVVPGIDVIFLDTGYHFAETIGTRDAVAQIYPINLINVTPLRTVAEQDRDLGPRLHGRNPNICCHLRKVEPLQRALEPYDAWLTGLRRDEAATRRDIGVVQWDRRKRMVKVNPIARWTQDDVDAYMAEHGVLVNPLRYDDYLSIGCAPCTRRVAPGEDPRAGRWAGLSKTECGIHL
ncbi:phosphoadenylyl-sulfate reductase [Streptomonospora nanhaiensis]|uniref:Adenosine 5'-phosphosulfate reductase n=1 Tax=Streptomonospora nanhaiensis TaxID=1323731 RepID=A0A853BGZ8_9ACTN|nr:phosphoadenylyl-sulfate reductase [Streptomonospora nanhaiensis]MBV2366132.1 phosphoadenylyl-sulfate reductase [Streptomonospora nanhaiensis]MBX9390227.1 phosphoadenylyl-sulfate reductase [Streptomonospora nanhaiensis]NYI93891.1 phosphoadenosine phosphosulfate reductase [Streptomonospora nanhaiensis]